MDYLKLPVVKTTGFKEKQLPMDDYLQFVCNNLKTTVNLNLIRELKKEFFVGVRFVLK
jgi:cell fate (sporulation/competence/biofilm development) regulator YmcA (YheA/YmcA/DUF963 family)